MATLEAIQTKVKKLQAQVESIVAKRVPATLDRIRELMEKHGITIADIQAHVGRRKRGSTRVATSATAPTSAAKYRDPKTGATWSGRGRAPAWIASVKDRTRFLVDANTSSLSPASSNGKRRGNYVRGPQPAQYRDPETGATWSGRGRAPSWIGNVKDRSKFLIAGADTKAETTVATTPNKARKKASSTAAEPGRKGRRTGNQPAKYLNPETGATWSGRGPAPAWLAAETDRSKFLIDGASA